jgi:hypothetical protein
VPTHDRRDVQSPRRRAPIRALQTDGSIRRGAFTTLGGVTRNYTASLPRRRLTRRSIRAPAFVEGIAIPPDGKSWSAALHYAWRWRHRHRHAPAPRSPHEPQAFPESRVAPGGTVTWTRACAHRKPRRVTFEPSSDGVAHPARQRHPCRGRMAIERAPLNQNPPFVRAVYAAGIGDGSRVDCRVDPRCGGRTPGPAERP